MTTYLKQIFDNPEATIWFGVACTTLLLAIGHFGAVFSKRKR